MWKCFWDWLATLPQGSASFVGTLAGSTLGLIALLLGALFNAHLNRKRDDRLRNEDRRTVAAALHAELSSIEKTLLGNAEHLIKKSSPLMWRLSPIAHYQAAAEKGLAYAAKDLRGFQHILDSRDTLGF